MFDNPAYEVVWNFALLFFSKFCAAAFGWRLVTAFIIMFTVGVVAILTGAAGLWRMPRKAPGIGLEKAKYGWYLLGDFRLKFFEAADDVGAAFL